MPGKISYPEFMMNVENGSISSAVIKPNRGNTDRRSGALHDIRR